MIPPYLRLFLLLLAIALPILFLCTRSNNDTRTKLSVLRTSRPTVKTKLDLGAALHSSNGSHEWEDEPLDPSNLVDDPHHHHLNETQLANLVEPFSISTPSVLLPFTSNVTVLDHRRTSAGVIPPYPDGQWPTHKVIVPAVFKEFMKGVPLWARSNANYTVYLYQRLRRKSPRFSYNFGHDAGVFLKFIVDFYDHLPNITIFTHARPEDHNKAFFDWVRCLRPDMNYTNLNQLFLRNRGLGYWASHGWGGWVEQCWRDLLTTFGLHFPPRKEPRVSTYCCAQFAISRSQLLRHPYSAYVKALHMLGEPPEVCHEGPLEVEKLWARHVPGQKMYQEHPKFHGKHTAAGAFEHLQHIVLGGYAFFTKPYGPRHWCTHFLPATQCAGSPCKWSIPGMTSTVADVVNTTENEGAS